VLTVAAAELDGRPVVISGSSDETVRVWDLATGTPVGSPFTGHDDWVRSVAAAKLDGRPVVISGSSDRTVRVWDLATGTPVNDPFTGHSGPVLTVAAAELDGRPVVISGSSDRTVRVWNLATGTPVGDPFTGHNGPVTAVAAQISEGLSPAGWPACVGVGATNIASVSTICLEDNGKFRSEHIAAPEVKGEILALALTSRCAIIVASELGIVVFDLPRTTVQQF
jgi:WD40 repeat protein